MTSFLVGQRVREANDRSKGTIRYIGEVDGSTGVWLGVEWDDPSRGRHDGSIDDKRYFECTAGGAGSFVRPRRCLHAVSLLQAVQSKYTNDTEKCERFIIGKNSEVKKEFKIPINFVGEDLVAAKQSQLDKLSCVSLRGMEVATIESNALDFLRSLQEIDLEDNLLFDWDQIMNVFSDVVELRLGKNKLCPTIARTILMRDSPAPSRLKRLMLNSVENAWKHVCELAKHGFLSALTDLHLGDNHIDVFDGMPESGLDSLMLLDLTRCSVSDWSALACFSSLPSLSTLIVDYNQLESLGPISPDAFPKLSSLSLYANQISSIDCLIDLRNLSALKSLRIQKNPIETSFGFRQIRALVIGLLPNLDILNRSEITNRERKNSELEFLRFCRSSTSSLHRCSRHLELLSKYENDIDTGLSKVSIVPGQPTTLSLKIRSNLAPSMTIAPTTRNVLQSMTLDLVVQLARRYFKIEQSKELDLYYHDPDSGFPMLLDDWSKSLEFYAIRSGGEIIVESKGKVATGNR